MKAGEAHSATITAVSKNAFITLTPMLGVVAGRAAPDTVHFERAV
jgi:hypothetical protein